MTGVYGSCVWAAIQETSSVGQNSNNNVPSIRWVPSVDDHYLCGGYYQEPAYPYPEEMPFDVTLPLRLSADQSSLFSNERSSLVGHVMLQQGNRTLYADQVSFEHNAETRRIEAVKANGHFLLTQPGLQIEGLEASADFLDGLLTIREARYLLPQDHARGEADKIALSIEKNLLLKKARYTTCPPTDPDWELRAERINLNQPSGRGHAQHAKLFFKEVPVLYFPYVNFPIDKRRQSGFLYPTFGQSNLSGTHIEIPYYWNIAPNFDTTLTPNWLQKRGVQLQGHARYLTASMNGSIRGSLLPADRAYQAFREDKLLNYSADGLSQRDPRVVGLSHGHNRKSFSWQHESLWGPHFSGRVNYTRVSDDNYFVDLSNDIRASSTSSLAQEGTIYYDGRHWHNFLKIQQFQTLHPYDGAPRDEVYQRQPQWALSASYPEILRPFQFDFQGEWTHFTHQSNSFTPLAFTKGQRLHAEPIISLPLYRPYGYLLPRLHMDYTYYALSKGPADPIHYQGTQLHRLLPIAEVDGALYFDRYFRFLNHQNAQQTLEPRLYYLYVPYKNQDTYPNFDSGLIDFSYAQLFRPNRFSSIDRVGDAHQLSTSLTSRFLTDKKEKLRISAGLITYFQDRRVFLCDPVNTSQCELLENPYAQDRRSDLAASMRYQINPEWRIDADWEWNPQVHLTDKGGLNMAYRGPTNQIFNLGYQYLRRDQAQIDLTQGLHDVSLKQVDISGTWPLHQQWQALARWHYDLTERRFLNSLMGVEYNSCCVAFQLGASRYLRGSNIAGAPPYAHAILMSFLLKGLSTLSMGQESQRLSTEIPGFRSFSNTPFTKNGR